MNDRVTYRIPDWANAFESSASRKLKNPGLCCHSNRAGRGMRRLARLTDGAAIYGCFIALCNVQSARRPEHRLEGWLTDDGTETGEAWTAEDMEDFCGFDAELFARMLAVLSAPRIGWITPPPSEPADSDHLGGGTLPAGRSPSPNDRQTDGVSEPNSISDSNGGDGGTDSDSEAAPELSPPPLNFPNPRAVPCNFELETRTIQADIDARRETRRLAPVVGHMATSPIAAALREPGGTLDHLTAVVAFEFAKYDAAPDKSLVISHLTPKNLFNARYLSDAIDRAGRYADDPAAWNFATSTDAADGLAAELANFNKEYS